MVTVDAVVEAPPTYDQEWELRGSRIGEVVYGILSRGAVLVGVLFVVAPLVVIVGTSLNRPPALSFPPAQVSLSSYSQIPSLMYSAFWLSVKLALCGSAIAVVLGVPAAFGLVRGRFPGTRLVEALLRAPTQVPEVVLGLAAYAFFVLVQQDIGIGVRSSFLGLLLIHVILVTPYVLTVGVSRISGMSLEQEEAAVTLGAGFFRVARRILWPALRQAVIGATLLAFLISFDNVPVSLYLAGTGSTTLPVALFDVAEVTLSPIVYATATLTVVFALIVTVILDRVVGIRSALGREP